MNLQFNICQVQEAGFKGNRPTKIIVHGFLDTGQEVWVKVGMFKEDKVLDSCYFTAGFYHFLIHSLFQDMTNALLEAGDCNVIAIDWGGGSLPLYR